MILSKLGENIFSWLTIIRPLSLVFPDPAGPTTEMKQWDWVLICLINALVPVDYGPNRLTKVLICLMQICFLPQKAWEVIQKITRIGITKWWIKITSNDRSSFIFSPQQKFRLNGGRSWLFSSKTNRSMLHWEVFVKSGSSTTCCSFFRQMSL